MWVALKDTVRRYTAGGTLALEVSVKQAEHLTSDGQGGVWVATDKTLSRLNQAGVKLAQLEQFKGEKQVVALVTHPLDHSVWAASKKQHHHLTAEGHSLQAMSFKDGRVQALALYADTLAPTVRFSTPVPNTLLNTSTPPLQLSHQDLGQGVNPTTLRLQANGAPLQATCMTTNTTATCTPSGSLAEGIVTLTATIQDYAGNTSLPTTLRVIVDTIPPIAPTPGQLTVGPVTNGQVTITGTAGSVEGATRVTITNTRTGETVTVTATAEGSFTAQLVAQAGDSLSITVMDAAGNVSPTATMLVGVPLSVRITHPSTGSTVESDQLLVQGTFTGPPNTGITVNGVVASISGDIFVANDVPLAAGSNTLTATATTLDGQTETNSVTVSSHATPPMLTLRASPSSGVAPLEVTFAHEFNAIETMQSLSIDFEGDGTVDVTTVDPTAVFQHTYPAPGVYVANLSLTDQQGQVHAAEAAVVVQDAAAMDVVFQGLWSGMNAALLAGDTATARTFLTAGAREKYGPVFDLLLPYMPEIIASYLPLQQVSISSDIGEYAITQLIDGQNPWRLVTLEVAAASGHAEFELGPLESLDTTGTETQSDSGGPGATSGSSSTTYDLDYTAHTIAADYLGEDLVELDIHVEEHRQESSSGSSNGPDSTSSAQGRATRTWTLQTTTGWGWTVFDGTFTFSATSEGPAELRAAGPVASARAIEGGVARLGSSCYAFQNTLMSRGIEYIDLRFDPPVVAYEEAQRHEEQGCGDTAGYAPTGENENKEKLAWSIDDTVHNVWGPFRLTIEEDPTLPLHGLQPSAVPGDHLGHLWSWGTNLEDMGRGGETLGTVAVGGSAEDPRVIAEHQNPRFEKEFRYPEGGGGSGMAGN